MRVAVVTIAVGEKYLSDYNRIFRRNTEAYCERHGYNFHLITDYIFTDNKYKKPVFVDIMKWTIAFYPLFRSYDYIMIVDADILLTPTAPGIETLDLGDKIGCVNEWTQPSYEERERHHYKEGWADKSPSQYYNVHLGETVETDCVMNGGLLIVSPKYHADWFRKIFNECVDGTLTARIHPFHYEQASLGLNLLKSNNYKIIDNKWNTIWNMYKNFNYDHDTLYGTVYAMHYAGHVDWSEAERIAL